MIGFHHKLSLISDTTLYKNQYFQILNTIFDLFLSSGTFVVFMISRQLALYAPLVYIIETACAGI